MPNLENAVRLAGGEDSSLERAQEAINIVKKIITIDESKGEFFACNQHDADGSNILNSLWFITNTVACEIYNFKSNEICHFDTMRINNFLRAEIKVKDFNLETTTSSSMIYIHLNYTEGISATFTAAGNNASTLLEIYENYLKPNLPTY